MQLDDLARRELALILGDRPEALLGADALRARPVTTDQVAGVVRWANRHGLRLYPTSSGRASAVTDGLTLDLSGLSTIVEVNREDMLAVAQTGALVSDLAASAQQVGLEYPPAFVAAPNETMSDRLSICSPKVLCVFVMRATRPSSESSTIAQNTPYAACSKRPFIAITIA